MHQMCVIKAVFSGPTAGVRGKHAEVTSTVQPAVVESFLERAWLLERSCHSHAKISPGPLASVALASRNP